MFQLFAVLLVWPMSAFLISPIPNFFSAALIVSDCDECGFNDLGKLLFGGLAAAIIVGVALPLVLRRMKKGRPDESQFVSINVTGAKKRKDAR